MAGCVSLTKEQIEVILTKTQNQRDKTLLITGLYTGFRISELLSLKIEDVFSHGQVVQTLKVQKRNMKGRVSSRQIPLNEKARVEIGLLIKSLGNSPVKSPLFQSRNGDKQGHKKSLSRCQAIAIIKELCNLAEVQGMTGTHVMRKTFAAKVYTNLKYDILSTSKALGHSDLRNTVRYLQTNEDLINQAILAS